MTPLSAFRSRIAPHLAGCSDLLIDQAVLDTCIDFADRSSVVKRMLDTFVTVASQPKYTLTAPVDQSVATITRLWCDSTELTPLDDDTAGPFGFVASIPGQTNPPGTPRFFSETAPGQVGLFPTPNSVYTINIRVALRPTRAATQVEDQLFEDWVDPIVEGALSRLFLMPGDFHDSAKAKIHATLYEGGVNAAMLESRSGATRAESRITPVHI